MWREKKALEFELTHDSDQTRSSQVPGAIFHSTRAKQRVLNTASARGYNLGEDGKSGVEQNAARPFRGVSGNFFRILIASFA